MAKTPVYNLKGEKVSEHQLNAEIFGIETNPVLIANAVMVQQANARNPIANTKTRGEVSGGGKKPWKQKGTGRARAGSSRSPLWIGGGITFGPRSARNFTKSLNRKMRNSAIRMALTNLANEKRLVIVDELTFEKPSTKAFSQVLNNLPIKEGKILVVLAESNINVELSMANIGFIKTLKAENINLVDLMNYDYLLTTLNGVNKIVEILGDKTLKTKTAEEK